jgi:hypothetical protein
MHKKRILSYFARKFIHNKDFQQFDYEMFFRISIGLMYLNGKIEICYKDFHPWAIKSNSFWSLEIRRIPLSLEHI